MEREVARRRNRRRCSSRIYCQSERNECWLIKASINGYITALSAVERLPSTRNTDAIQKHHGANKISWASLVARNQRARAETAQADTTDYKLQVTAVFSNSDFNCWCCEDASLLLSLLFFIIYGG